MYKLPKHSLASIIYALAPILARKGEEEIVLATDNYIELCKDEHGVPKTLYDLLIPLIDRLPGVKLVANSAGDNYIKDLTTDANTYPTHQHLIRSMSEVLSGSRAYAESIDFSDGWLNKVFKKGEVPPLGLRKKSLFIGFSYSYDLNCGFFHQDGVKFNQVLEERFGPYRFFVGSMEECERYNKTLLVYPPTKFVPLDVGFLQLLYGIAMSVMVIGDSKSLVVAMAQALGKKHIVIDHFDKSAIDHSLSETQLHVTQHTSAEDIMTFITTDLK